MGDFEKKNEFIFKKSNNKNFYLEKKNFFPGNFLEEKENFVSYNFRLKQFTAAEYFAITFT